MSALETKAAAEAQTVHEEIRHAVVAMRNAWLWLAERLFRFHDKQMWEALGYQSFDEYLASPELELGRRQVYTLIEAWRVLVIEKHVDPKELEDVEVSKVKEVLPAIRKGNIDPLAALADVRTLGREDLRLRYAQQGSQLDAPHGPNGHPGYTVCPTCGSRVTAGSVT